MFCRLQIQAKILYKDKVVMSFLFEDLTQSTLEAKGLDASKFQSTSACKS
jgi:hypothetical protein